MRGFFNGLIIGVILGAVGYWFVEKRSLEHPVAEQHSETAASQAPAPPDETGSHLSDAFKAKLDALDLRTDEIKDELARTGKIIRRKATDFGGEVADATADARIVAAIKASYAVDPNLSVWKISVSSSQGHVTLSGTVSAPEDIGRAVALALGTDGVRDVVSTIEVRPSS
jgi:hypothetical protein